MSELLAVVTVTMLAVISPGPDFALVSRNSLALSRRAGVLTALGIGAGVLIHAGYTLLGVGMLIRQSPWALDMVRLLGAGYLLYLGLSMLRSAGGSESPADSEVRPFPAACARAFRTGLLANLLNPKTAVFIISLFLQAVGADTPVRTQIGYGLFVAAAHVGWFALVAVCFSAGPVRSRLLRARQRIDQLFGSLLVGLSILLLLRAG